MYILVEARISTKQLFDFQSILILHISWRVKNDVLNFYSEARAVNSERKEY